MAADDLSLLFRLRADNAQAIKATQETRAAVAQLRQSLGPELSQTVSASNKVFSDIGQNLNVFVGQRLPLVGGAFVRVTENLKNFTSESSKTEQAVAKVATSIQSIAEASGKTAPQITTFLSKFVQLEGQAKRDAAAIEFFGATTGAKLIPQLETAGEELSALATESTAAGAAIGAMALPVGIAVAALAALVGGVVLAGKELFDLTKQTAEFEGRMLDLSQQTGLSVETLSALEVVAKTTGGEIGNLTQSIVNFQRQLDDAQDPTTKAAETFRKYGIEAKDTESALRQTIAALAKMPEGFQQTNAAAEFFGARGGKQFLAILKEMNGDLDGTIKKLRDMGIEISTEDARAADKFNDELALMEFQLRAAGAAIVKDALPEFLHLIEAVSDLVRASGPLLHVFSEIAGFHVRAVAENLNILSEQFRNLKIIVQLATGDLDEFNKKLKESQERQNLFQDNPQGIPTLKVPDVQPAQLPQKSARDAAIEATQTAEAVVAAVKRAAADTNQALSQMFEQGRIGRQKQAQETIASIQQVRDAEFSRIDAAIAQRKLDLRSLDASTDAYKKLNDEIGKLVQERQDKEAEAERQISAIRAKAAKERADSLRNEEQNHTDLLLNEYDRRIKATEEAIKRGETVEAEGLTIIEALEQGKIDARKESLQKQKDIGYLTIQGQKDLDNQIRQVEQEGDRLRDEQEQRRLARAVANARRLRDLKLQELDTELELQRIVAERLISNQQTLTGLRVKSEEDAAKEILKIRLDLIDQEQSALQAKLQAAKSITDKDERVRVEADLNAQLKILSEQRKTIQADGNRDIEQGRQKDLDNERRYADELQRIRERIRNVQENTAREVIRLMQIHFASRRDIVRAQTQLNIDAENQRHAQAEATIRELERENRESHRTLAERLAAEIEIDGLREAEAERHRKAMQGIADQGKRDEALAGPGGGFDFGLNTGQLKEIEGGIKSFQDVATTAFSAVGAVVNGLAQGVGSLVQQWVLLGTTGPAAFRKLVASVLAGVAAQAATMAIMELAYGIAALTPWGAAIYGPAPFHFKSAALFGAIAVGAGLAGRAVAGGLFSQGAGGGGSTGTTDRAPNQLNSLDLERNTGNRPLTIKLLLEQHVKSNDSHIIKTVVRDFQLGGDTREAINNDGVLT